MHKRYHTRVKDNDEVIITVWKKAVEIQDSLYYNEPLDRYYPVWESLGGAYLK